MKEIWINLELYIKSNEFSIFRDFFRLILRFLNDKNNLKNAKRVLFPRGTHVDATWHTRPRGRATRAHAAPTRRCDGCALFIYTYIAFRLSEGNYCPSDMSRLINLSNSLNFSRVGLSSTRFLNMQVTWPIVER